MSLFPAHSAHTPAHTRLHRQPRKEAEHGRKHVPAQLCAFRRVVGVCSFRSSVLRPPPPPRTRPKPLHASAGTSKQTSNPSPVANVKSRPVQSFDCWTVQRSSAKTQREPVLSARSCRAWVSKDGRVIATVWACSSES